MIKGDEGRVDIPRALTQCGHQGPTVEGGGYRARSRRNKGIVSPATGYYPCLVMY